MTELIENIASAFDYNCRECDADDCLTTRGIYTFEGDYMCEDVVIIAKYEDGDVVDYFTAFSCNPKFIPEGLEDLIKNMIKLFIKDGFVGWKENYL